MIVREGRGQKFLQDRMTVGAEVGEERPVRHVVAMGGVFEQTLDKTSCFLS